MQLTISFSRVQCACGVERQAGSACPECGREPEEVDEDLERRRAIVAGIRGTQEAVGDATPLELDDWIPSLGAWLDQFWEAYETTGEGSVDDAASRLRDSLEQLDFLNAFATHARRLRPAHALWRAIDDTLTAFACVRDTYLEALTAATPKEAENASARGQDAIDAAAAALARFNDFSDAWQHVDRADLADEYGDVFAGAEAVAALSGTSDIVELDRKGAELFERITNRDAACPTGFGVRLQFFDLAVEASMEPTRFWSTARSVYMLLVTQPAALRALFADPDWRSELVAISVETRDAGFEAMAVAAVSANRRRILQSALRLAARQIERVAQPLLATLRAVTERKPYASERKRDIGALLRLTTQAGHEDLLFGLDEKLRDADAHRAFTIDDTGVRLTGTRGKLGYLTDDELVDVTLGCTESITALYWGLIAALVAAGVDLDALNEAAAAEVSATDRVKLVLLLNGWHQVEVMIDGTHLIAKGERDSQNALGLIGALVSVVPEGCEEMTLTVVDESGPHKAMGPLAPYRRWRSADTESAKGIAFVLAAMAWRIDGAPILTRAHIEKVFAYRAVEALDVAVPPREALPALRGLLDAAREIGSTELASAIALVLRLRREVAMGISRTENAQGIVAALDPWLLADMPTIQSSW